MSTETKHAAGPNPGRYVTGEVPWVGDRVRIISDFEVVNIDYNTGLIRCEASTNEAGWVRPEKCSLISRHPSASPDLVSRPSAEPAPPATPAAPAAHVPEAGQMVVNLPNGAAAAATYWPGHFLCAECGGMSRWPEGGGCPLCALYGSEPADLVSRGPAADREEKCILCDSPMRDGHCTGDPDGCVMTPPASPAPPPEPAPDAAGVVTPGCWYRSCDEWRRGRHHGWIGQRTTLDCLVASAIVEDEDGDLQLMELRDVRFREPAVAAVNAKGGA